MTFFEVAAQVLPVIFLALVFDQRALLGDQNERWRHVAVDLGVLAAFAIGEAISLYVLLQNSAFTASRHIVVVCLGIELIGLVVPHAQQRLRAFARQTPWRRVAVGLAAAVPLLIAGAFLAFGLRAASKVGVETIALPPSPRPPPPPFPPPTPPRPILTTTGAGLRLGVTNWQALPAPRSQVQIKLKLSIKNVSTHSISVRITRWRLIVRTFDPTRWTPPRIGPKTTGLPIKVRYLNERAWAVPPNADSAYDRDLDINTFTFATHWDATVLAPGELYFPTESRRGVLVYYVPRTLTARGLPTLAGVIGAGRLGTGGDVVVVPRQRWGPRTPANVFY